MGRALVVEAVVGSAAPTAAAGLAAVAVQMVADSAAEMVAIPAAVARAGVGDG